MLPNGFDRPPPRATRYRLGRRPAGVGLVASRSSDMVDGDRARPDRFPVLIMLRRHGFTNLALLLIALHGLVLMLGGAYTYARVPIGFVVQDWLHLARNPYDRFGHLMQGFVPAIVLREVLIRTGGIASRRLLTVTVLAYCLSVSALYELIEFGAAVALGQGADAFLGTQGDPWDTQWDMLMCLVGAALALILLSRVHDRQMARLRSSRLRS
jgi:putative membrane protein